MTSSTRWLRLCTGVFVLACLALAMLGGTASATLSLDKTTDTTLTLDSDAHWFNNPSRAQVMNGYQYWAYWDAADRSGIVYLKIARRRLSDGNVVQMTFDGREGAPAYELDVHTDGHNFASIGLSPNDGRLHLSWSLHTSDRRHRYVISNEGCMGQTQETFDFGHCTFTRSETWAQSSDTGHEAELTYPIYFNDNEGKLYMTFRYDASARGDQYLNCYNDNGTWETLGRIIFGGNRGGQRPGSYTFDPDGPEGPERELTSQTRGVYLSGIVFDKNEVAHLAWVWRDYEYNNGINYLYSTDHMRTWRRDRDGEVISTSDTDPIVIADRADTVVVEAPPGRWPSGSLKVDSENNPHIFGLLSDVWTSEETKANKRPVHWWGNSSGSWYQEYAGGPELGSSHLVGGDLIFDQADNLYATFGRESLGWAAWNRDPYVLAELPSYNVVSQPGGYLDVRPTTETVRLRTMEYLGTDVTTSGVDQLRVRMKNNTRSTEAALYWTFRPAAREAEWTEARSQTFRGAINARDREYTTYTLNLTSGEWRGSIRELEFRPVMGVPAENSVSIDWIQLYNSRTRAAVKTWNMDSGMKLLSAEAPAANNWRGSWTVDTDLLPGVDIQNEDGAWPFSDSRYAYDRVLDFTAIEQHEPGIESLAVHEFDILGDDGFIKDWNFDTDTVNWTAPNNISEFRWRDDRGTMGLSGTITGRDSQLVSASRLAVPIGSTRYVHIRMRNESATRRAEIYFQTNAERTWTEPKSKAININARDTRYTEYSIDMSAVTRWRNETLYQFRIDPSDESNERGSFNIDRIWINNTR